MKGSTYIENVKACIDRAWETQRDKIALASDLIVSATKKKNNIYFFGCSHAGIIAEEVFYRSGGMVTINPIMFPGFMLNTRPVTMTSKLERLPGLGKIIFDENKLVKGDILFIHSVSGRNAVPVELAEEAAAAGVQTVAITNLEYSKSVISRATSGRNLWEVCDIVIDNCGCAGDASVSLDGLPEKIGPTSTAVGAALVNALIIEAVEKLIAKGVVPPVFMSANIDGGTEHNAKILEEYKDNIFYM
ncbi:MAG: SIS domain-containing protein [Clostridia bacterium]|nr:SIS domain-containing protein [Clostridia bacterium]